MLMNSPALEHPVRLSDRLAAAQQRRFVGRRAELELFSSALATDEPPFAVLHVHGPGGVGKSALLQQYVRLADAAGRRTVLLDGRDLEPTPAGFLARLGDALSDTEPLIILLDTYEVLAALDAWLRRTFLPRLPERSLVVIAGRSAPDAAWTADLGWSELVRVISLRNLRPQESRAFLSERRVPAEQHEPVLAFTHGHPLAMALVADAITRSGRAASFRPEDAPDIVRLLLKQFVAEVPGARHRQALEAGAHVRVTGESLLGEVVSDQDAHELFEWLRGLSFMEQGCEGLFPHDLAREVLDADFRWREPDEYAELHRRIWRHLRRRMRETTGRAQQRVFFDKIYLHRTSAVGLLYHDYASLGHSYGEPACATDHAAILDTVRRHEGEESACIAAHWLRRQPEGFVVLRDENGALLGFVATITIHDASAEDCAVDPAVALAHAHFRRHAPLREGEVAAYHRFVMACDRYQDVGPVINLLALSVTVVALQHPRLAWSMGYVAEPEKWLPLMSYVNFEFAPEADFNAGGKRFAVFAHDWRTEPWDLWWDRLADRSINLEVQPEPPRSAQTQLVVLSEPEFALSVRRALRDYTSAHELAANPLLRSRLVREAADGQPVPALQALLREALEQVRSMPRAEKFARALHYTYIQPARSQEQAAERLGLPFTTYRYHLSRGIELVTRCLWERELYGTK